MSHLPSSYGAEGTKAEDRKWEKEILIERYIRKPTWRRRHLLFHDRRVYLYLYLSIDLFFSPFYCLPALSGKRCCISSSHFHAPSSSSSFSRGRGFTRLHKSDSSNPAPFCQQRDTVRSECALTPTTEIGYFGEERKRRGRINQGRREKKKEKKNREQRTLFRFPYV